MKLRRKSRIGTPPNVPSFSAMWGSAAAEMLRPSTSGARMSRARGPCTAITAHCSVVEVSQTRRSGNSVWMKSSMWAITRGAPPVVVVTWKRSSAMRPTTPSSMMKPDSFSISP